jgi:hypothetical protein
MGFGAWVARLFRVFSLMEAACRTCESGIAAVLGFASGMGRVSAVVNDFANRWRQPDAVQNFDLDGEADCEARCASERIRR